MLGCSRSCWNRSVQEFWILGWRSRKRARLSSCACRAHSASATRASMNRRLVAPRLFRLSGFKQFTSSSRRSETGRETPGHRALAESSTTPVSESLDGATRFRNPSITRATAGSRASVSILRIYTRSASHRSSSLPRKSAGVGYSSLTVALASSRVWSRSGCNWARRPPRLAEC